MKHKSTTDMHRIRELAQDPQFIDDIYYYCDQWCERCVFSSRCLDYSLRKESGEPRSGEEKTAPSAVDCGSRTFLEDLAEGLQATVDRIDESIVILSVDEPSTPDGKRERLAEQIRDHDCVKQAQTYGTLVEKWFELSTVALESRRRTLARQLEMDLPGDTPEEDMAALADAMEVVGRYRDLIRIKLVWALLGRFGKLTAGLGGHPDGSAKVALIAMDRSLAAWRELFRQLPPCENEILDILLHLDHLRRRTEEMFPDAWTFVRPGFDE